MQCSRTFGTPRDDGARLRDITEAAKGVSEETRARLPDVPWSDMAGMRDVVVHQYFGIDAALVWRAASVSVPRLLGSLGT